MGRGPRIIGEGVCRYEVLLLLCRARVVKRINNRSCEMTDRTVLLSTKHEKSGVGVAGEWSRRKSASTVAVAHEPL